EDPVQEIEMAFRRCSRDEPPCYKQRAEIERTARDAMKYRHGHGNRPSINCHMWRKRSCSGGCDLAHGSPRIGAGTAVWKRPSKDAIRIFVVASLELFLHRVKV